MDALTLLKADHQAVEAKFARFEALGPRAVKSKAAVVADVIEALSVHAAIEEQVLYPALRDRLGDEEGQVLEALEEHHVVKWVLSELDGMSPDHERFDAKFTVLIENVRHHVKEEESELFPQGSPSLHSNRARRSRRCPGAGQGDRSDETAPALAGRATDERSGRGGDQPARRSLERR